jgi:hypothetical protein
MSISGLTATFAGATAAVIGMGAALELGKLSAVAWLGHARGHRYGALRAALTGLVFILMALNSVGTFGFLSRAHLAHAVTSAVTVDAKAADVAARIEAQTGVVGRYRPAHWPARQHGGDRHQARPHQVGDDSRQ